MAAVEYVLFSWGANSYGQLGLGHTDDQSLPCKMLTDGSKLKQVTGGGGHTILLNDDGKIFVCGWNKNGQLGILPSDSAPTANIVVPIPLPNQQWKATKVSCGWNHTLALIEGGGVVAWGSNVFGQLGLPHVNKQSIVPLQIPREVFTGDGVGGGDGGDSGDGVGDGGDSGDGGGNVIDVGAGLRHSVAVTESGQLFCWGDGRKGQLGLGEKHLHIQSHPQCILFASASKFVAVSVGSHHSAALTATDGILLSWGLNRHGQCGISSLTDELKLLGEDHFKMCEGRHITNVYVPVEVKDIPPLAEVHCGWSHTIVITRKDRVVLGWGRYDYGQLGQDRLDSSSSWDHVPREILQLKGAKQVECGSEHNIAINADNKVVSFGWNEHGICGTGGDEGNIMTPTELSSLQERDCLLVGAGAGHSFAMIVK